MIACTIATGPAAQQVRTRLEAVADAGEVGRLAVTDGDHEVRAREHVDLAELDGLGLVEVPGRAQHEEEHVAVALELGSLVGLDRVLHRELVQVELRGDGGELGRVGPVEPDPRDPVAVAARRVELGQRLGGGDALSVAVDGSVDDHPGPAYVGARAHVATTLVVFPIA